MLVITIVKSSLALSLGLVGALSIVRFRAAIKEPEEIIYLFLAIAIGLGFGANQGTITIAAFAAISGVIALRNFRRDPDQTQNLWLTVSSHAPQEVTLEQMIEIFKKNSVTADIKRFDETKDIIEASFLIECDNFQQLSKAKLELQKLNDSIKVTFLDNRGML